MKLPLPPITPVAIALDEISTTGDVSFSGIDLDSGARVTVSIKADHADPAAKPSDLTPTLVLVLSIETHG